MGQEKQKEKVSQSAHFFFFVQPSPKKKSMRLWYALDGAGDYALPASLQAALAVQAWLGHASPFLLAARTENALGTVGQHHHRPGQNGRVFDHQAAGTRK